MKTPAKNAAPPASDPAPVPIFWPFVTLALSLALVLGWSLAQGITNLRTGRARLAGQEPLLQQAARMEATFRPIMEDLLALAQTNDAARAIVTKWQIAVQPPKSAATAAPAPTPATPSGSPAPTTAPPTP